MDDSSFKNASSWDDTYSKKISQIDFSCSMVLSLKKLFFGTGLNMYVEDAVIRHILTCKKCRETFLFYAKEVGYKKFDVIKYAIRFVEDHKSFTNSKTKEYLEEVHENKALRVLSQPWTTAANRFDIYKLMNMKAFRDLSNEYNSPTGMDYSDFMKYIALKFAQKIDHLELCLLKTEQQLQAKEKVKDNNEKS